MECHAEPVGLESHANIDLSQWVLHRAERGRDRTRLSRDTQHAASHDKLQPVHWQAKASNETLASPCHHSKSTSSIPSEISDTPVRDTVMSIRSSSIHGWIHGRTRGGSSPVQTSIVGTIGSVTACIQSCCCAREPAVHWRSKRRIAQLFSA